MAGEMVPCPTCEGTGAGPDVGSECVDCAGSGDVTRSRRSTLLRVRSGPVAALQPAPPAQAPERSDDGARVRPQTKGREPRVARRVAAPSSLPGEWWSRPSVPKILPWVTYRQLDNWQRIGLWEPAFPTGGSGSRAAVNLADLEGLALIGRLAAHLSLGAYATHTRTMPAWAEIRRACHTGGVWIAANGRWGRWEPGVDPPPTVGVIVDVGVLVRDVRDRSREHRTAA